MFDPDNGLGDLDDFFDPTPQMATCPQSKRGVAAFPGRHVVENFGESGMLPSCATSFWLNTSPHP